MKVFLSGAEASEKTVVDYWLERGEKIDYLLVSYYYVRNKKNFMEKAKRLANEILVDSGAHSFQKGIKVDWVKYTQEYADWIQENDCPQILGYFEMDVDNIIGYANVLALRGVLDQVSDKIIPVWHKNRGVSDYKKMCSDYTGKLIAVTGFRNEDIQDHQYLMFLKYARKFNCKVHCLGMTRLNIMDTCPFYSVDSSSWKQTSVYGAIKLFRNNRYISAKFKSKYKTEYLERVNFAEFVKLQKYYKQVWREK